MKTTLDLPDDLFIAAKNRAADEGRSLRDLIVTALRQQLHGHARRRRPSPVVWVTVKGGLPEGVDVTDRDRMHGALRFRA